jgi:predicted DNA-binding protein (MmcQ/YjbR family)
MADVTDRVEEHFRLFNEAVRNRDWAAFLASFTPDAVMRFEGVPASPYEGLEQIARAYAEQPPSDTMSCVSDTPDGDHGEFAMTWEELLTYCLAMPGAWQDEPWEGDVVAKVGAKIFAFLGSGTSVGLKCGASREAADEWLLRYPDDASVMAYIGRSGWNTLRIGGAIPDDELTEAIDASYAAVVSKLPKKDRPA